MPISTLHSKTTGYIFNIQRYSVHDGQGIRTNVFLKGCPLRCHWCSNPESQNPLPELARNEGRCLGIEACGFCLRACPNEALALQGNDMPAIVRDKCISCMSCASLCPTGALTPYGEQKTAGEVVDEVEKDSIFYARSGGGMTLSGGEPLMQADFALAILREAKRRRIHTAIETCGHVPWKTFEQAVPLIDEIMYDIKIACPDKHKHYTGADNTLILENFRKIAELYPQVPVKVRTPVIPGVNDSADDISAIIKLVSPYAHVRYELLPYHRLGTQKYIFLDKHNPMGDVTLDAVHMQHLFELVTASFPS